MVRPRVLLTGFGPFPGVPENPSGWLAETLAGQGSASDCDLHVEVLPTEWETVAALAPRLHADLQPHVMIHFGVDAKAKGLRLERSAHNRAAPRADACGARPGARAIAPDGAMRLDTALPVTTLAAHLRASGHAANASRSCGRYLCNFLYYRSLHWAQAQVARGQAGHALFVHVPLTRAQGGTLEQEALLRAGKTTLRFVLGAAAHPVPAQSQGPSPAVEARQ
jgi:pyroglutamyl-peptidase